VPGARALVLGLIVKDPARVRTACVFARRRRLPRFFSLQEGLAARVADARMPESCGMRDCEIPRMCSVLVARTVQTMDVPMSCGDLSDGVKEVICTIAETGAGRSSLAAALGGAGWVPLGIELK
jgi:hypothetical protein